MNGVIGLGLFRASPISRSSALGASEVNIHSWLTIMVMHRISATVAQANCYPA
jgi:hypothetical protein